ncbi:MAG TPA: response regulator [Dehalococcoidia bacterium]|nr:response regulator [Dehalococcoidia bacterium]
MADPLVIFINHNESLLKLAQLALTQAGFRAVTWRASEGAKELIAEQQPDVVIVDLWLERDGAGWEVYESLRDDPQTANIPVVITTESSRQFQEKLPLLRMDDRAALLRKPYDWDALLKTIREISGVTPNPA